MNDLENHFMTGYFIDKIAELEKRNARLQQELINMSAELRQARLQKQSN